MLKVLIYALPIILAVYALVDLVQTKDEEVQGLPKLVWVVLIVFIWVIGPIAWLVAGRAGRRWLPGLSPRPAGPGRPGGGRPMAPDDDLDFLRGLRNTEPRNSEPRNTEPPPLPPKPAADDDDGTPDPPAGRR